MENQMKQILSQRATNKSIGIPSYCTANDLVIRAIVARAKETGVPALIEATANQVNQYGGYTGMHPADFVSFVYNIAEEMDCDKNLLILAGDHLGPLTWRNLDESEAMEKSKVLVYQYIKAGFTKIHLDTSMKLGSDSKTEMLPTSVIAQRGAILYQECMRAFAEIDDGTKVRPVFVIGSEVPIPGGATEAEEGISVTKVSDFKDTIDTYHQVFAAHGLEHAFDDIIGVVVQPGVEFGDSQVFLYDRPAAADLSASIEAYPGLVFEGHSTDYQTKECLKEMVEDNIAILKVGPALTYRCREALFALSMMEQELIPQENRANFIRVLEDTMVASPANWQSHYHGNDHELHLARCYSYSDRCRYYLTEPAVKAATDKLLANMDAITIPMNILHQYMPGQYQKIIRGNLEHKATAMVYDAILEIAGDYEYACH